MTDMGCAACGDATAELALGILTGPDRSAALDHIDRCAGCQAEVASLAAAADRLLDLIPARGAPAGFESRAAAAFRQPGLGQADGSRGAGKGRGKLAAWRWRVGAAVAAAVAIGLLGLGMHEIVTAPAEPAYRSAALRTPAGARAGEVAVTGEPRPWLVMIVNAGAAPGRYYCYLLIPGGRQEFAGAFGVDRDGGAWVVRLSLHDRHLIGARLVGPGGTQAASAIFSSTS